MEQFTLVVSQAKYDEIQEWCNENIGDWGCDERVRTELSILMYRYFHFKHTEDAIAFKLMWMEYFVAQTI